MAHIRVFPSLFPSSGLESGDVSNVPICSGPGPGRWVRGRGLGGCLQKILACPDACSLCCLALSRACLRYCRCCSAHVSQRVWSGMGERRIRRRARETWPSAVSLGRFGGSVLCAPGWVLSRLDGRKRRLGASGQIPQGGPAGNRRRARDLARGSGRYDAGRHRPQRPPARG